jgi:hypothetical protein
MYDSNVDTNLTVRYKMANGTYTYAGIATVAKSV